jgi:opacity protein-like surface antigen
MKLRAIAASFLWALTAVASAQAADMPGGWAPPPIMVPRFSELTSGWYIRLDAGYNWNKVGSVQSGIPVTGVTYQSSPDGTFGFGYKYQWIRFDLTVDRGFPSAVQATTTTVHQPQYSAKLSWTTVLGNAYIDMGTWWGFTPYIGAGVGATRLHSSDYSDTTMFGGNPNALTQSQTTNVSWAGMAGVAFQITPQWMVDVGYRYLDLGKVSNTTGSGLPTDYANFRNVSNQEVRIGIRFLID